MLTSTNARPLEDFSDDKRDSSLSGATLQEKNPQGFTVTDNGYSDDGTPHSSKQTEELLTPEGSEPTEYEIETLRHVGESLPFAVFLVAIIELCERFTYYGCLGTFQDYAQKPLDGSLGRGALGLGHDGATGLVTFYSFWTYITPLLGALVADQYLGKYRTILTFACFYYIGLLVLVITSIPAVLDKGAGLGGFIASILLTGLGTGGIKANVAALIAEQYGRRTMVIAITKKGERVIIDPYVMIQVRRSFLIHPSRVTHSF